MAKQISLKPTFTVLVGLPMCGKSTWTRNNKSEGDVVISLDDIMVELGETVHGIINDYDSCYNQVDVKAVKRLYNERLDEAIAQRKNIIVDKTNLTSKTRRRLLARVPRDYKRIAVVFNWDKDVLQQRNLKRKLEENKYIPQSVLEQMEKQYMGVNSDEGFDKILTVN